MSSRAPSLIHSSAVSSRNLWNSRSMSQLRESLNARAWLSSDVLYALGSLLCATAARSASLHATLSICASSIRARWPCISAKFLTFTTMRSLEVSDCTLGSSAIFSVDRIRAEFGSESCVQKCALQSLHERRPRVIFFECGWHGSSSGKSTRQGGGGGPYRPPPLSNVQSSTDIRLSSALGRPSWRPRAPLGSPALPASPWSMSSRAERCPGDTCSCGS